MADCVKTLCSGEKRTLVTVERKALVSDGAGGQEQTWSVIATAWGKVEMSNGGERFNQQQVDAIATHKFTFNWDDIAGILPQDRLVIGGEPYEFNVRSIDNVQFRNILGIVHAERGVLT